MSMDPRPDLRYIFASGLTGFVLGAFIVASVGGAPALTRPSTRPAPANGIDDVDGAIVETPPEPTATAGHTATPTIAPDEGSLESRHLDIPVDGVTRDQLVPSFHDARSGSREHEALDILAPRNTPVLAVEDGTIARLFLSKAGGITIYQFDPSQQYCYYYAHLERYADGLKEGSSVRRGQVLGYVGTTGNAPKDTPHLHFAIFRLTPEKRWWEGTPIDPYGVLR